MLLLRIPHFLFLRYLKFTESQKIHDFEHLDAVIEHFICAFSYNYIVTPKIVFLSKSVPTNNQRIYDLNKGDWIESKL